MKMNNKKLSRGMTLVEVLVAMTIFAIMAGVILSVITRANSTANRSKMRDVELAAQTNIISKGSKEQVTKIAPGGYTGEYTVVFNIPGAAADARKYSGVGVYETDEGEFSEDFGFQLKTLKNSASFNSLAITSVNDNEYWIQLENDLSEPITITITSKNGYIFEGTGRQYVHTRDTYTKTIPGGGVADVGFYSENFQNGDMKIEAKTAISGSLHSGLTTTALFHPTYMDSSARKAHIRFEGSGTDPVITAHTTYPK